MNNLYHLNEHYIAHDISDGVPPIVRLWLFRLLVPLGVFHKILLDEHFERLVDILDLNQCVKIEQNAHYHVDNAQFRTLHEAIERDLRNVQVPACLLNNITRLSTVVGLSETDCRILEFVVIMHNEYILESTADFLGHNLPSWKIFHALSVLLGIPERDIRTSLSPRGILIRSGLVSVQSYATTLNAKFDLLSDNFADTIYYYDVDPISLLRATVALGAPAQLSIADYGHIEPSLSVLRPYLSQSIAAGRKGVNIFIHGTPGTGKSQLARVLAQELGCELFEVSSENSHGNPVAGSRRLCAFRAAQCFLKQHRSLILFDEVEDVFSDRGNYFEENSPTKAQKAWINRMLEDNPIPTLWLSNSIQALDPAFIRRFDMVFELPIPPKKQRERILYETCGDLLDADSVARIAESETLAPALVARSASVVSSIRDALGKTGAASAFELLIGNTLEAQGYRPIRKNDPNRLPEIYDPCFIHADSDLALIAAGLAQSQTGRLCLFGPPGTGKTAYGRWLAEQMCIPLIVKRASDLLSMWHGETEKNIAKAFSQADEEGALLMIDEVDSFLQDRRNAGLSWEVCQVNEMLTQMESFSGVFVASTNLMYGLDQAALRRFDLKVKFDFLKPKQACELLHRYCAILSVKPPEPEQLTRLGRMQKLTPGDFATVMRQNRFRPITSSADLISALEAECALKEGASPSIGFLQ